LTVAEVIFYVVAVVAIAGALGTVLVPNVVHAALFLILSLLGTAGFYILLSSEFLALVQVLVYVGAVSTIILFGLMLTRSSNMPTVSVGSQWPFAAVTCIALGLALLVGVLDSDWPLDAGQVATVSIEAVGNALFERWLVPFEIASVVLIIALIGAIVISKQEESEA
jgi:NADH-quinone oxidoreductase subunit J